MEIKIQINTPKGAAEKTAKRIEPYILGSKKKIKHDIYINEEDSCIIWDVEGEPRKLQSINKNVAMYDKLVVNILNNKLVKKAFSKDWSAEEWGEFENLLKNHTTINIVKRATAEELVEYYKTWWDRVKETFKKK